MNNELQTLLDAIKLDKDTNLTPETLKEGISCLGIQGAVEIEEGTILYPSIEAMNAAGAEEGEFAIVYREEEKELTSTTAFSKVIFPETVVLPEVVSEKIGFIFRRADGVSTPQFDTSTYFELHDEGFGGQFVITPGYTAAVSYTTTDGITFNREALYVITSSETMETPEDGLLDFGNDLIPVLEKPEDMDLDVADTLWHDYIKYFMILPPEIYEGAYRYENGAWNKCTDIASSDDTTSTMFDIISGKSACSQNVKITGNLELKTELAVEQKTPYFKNEFSVEAVTENNVNKLKVVSCPLSERIALEEGTVLTIKQNQSSVAEAIGLTADQIIEGNTILGVEGTGITGIDTSDATAIAEDILVGKTAYAKGEKITGSLAPVTNSKIIPSADLHAIIYGDGNNLQFVYQFPNKELFWENSYIVMTPTGADILAQSAVTSDFIMKGYSVLGLWGTATADATATAEDITYGKSAYVDGKKVEGALQTYYTLGNDMFDEISVGIHADTGYISLNTICLDNAKLEKDNLLALDIAPEILADAIGLTADKLVKGNTILSVEGTGTRTFKTIDEMNSTEGTEGEVALVFNGTTYDGTYQYISDAWTEMFSTRRYEGTIPPAEYDIALETALNIQGG